MRDDEEKLDRLTVEDEIESKRMSIAQKKALEAEAKEKYGGSWRKVLGVVKSLKPDHEVIQDLYGLGLGDLRDLSDPRKTRRG